MHSVALRAWDGTLIADEFATVSGQDRSGLCWLEPDGALAWVSHRPEANGPVYLLAPDSEGNIVVEGDITELFDELGSKARTNIATLYIAEETPVQSLRCCDCGQARGAMLAERLYKTTEWRSCVLEPV